MPAIESELRTMLEKGVFKPVHAKDLTQSQRTDMTGSVAVRSGCGIVDSAVGGASWCLRSGWIHQRGCCRLRSCQLAHDSLSVYVHPQVYLCPCVLVVPTLPYVLPCLPPLPCVRLALCQALCVAL